MENLTIWETLIHYNNIPKNQACLNLIDIICLGSKDRD